jgi:hypothetical protein
MDEKESLSPLFENFLMMLIVDRTTALFLSPEKEERIVELLKFRERSCYATNTLRQPVEVIPRLLLNGREVRSISTANLSRQ